MTATEPILESLASKEYLKPLTAEECGAAVLQVSLTKSGEKFLLSIYERSTIKKYNDEGKLIETEQLIPPSSWRAAQFVAKRFKHGRKEVNRSGALYPQYEVPVTDYSVALIANAWKGEKQIKDSAKPLFNEIFLREFIADQNAKRTAEFKRNAAIPSDSWFDEHDKFLLSRGITLSPYQKVASYNACKVKSYAFFCDPGTGKTPMMIRKLDHVISFAGKQTMSIVLCPKSVRTNWANELSKFSMHYDNLQIVMLNGASAADRTVCFINAVQSTIDTNKHVVLICGYESFVGTPALHSLEWDMVALDESHNISNPGTKRTKTILETSSSFHHKIEATGTPFRNTPFDIFTQLEFLGKGYSGFDSFAAFKEFYGIFEPANSYNRMRQLTGFDNIPLLQEKLAKHAFIIRKEEALPFLPKKSFSIKECQMAPSQRKTYIQLANTLAAQIESYGPNPDSITVNNILTQMLRLAQITSGFCPTDAGELNRFNENPKLDLLISMLTGADEDGEQGSEGILSDPNRKAIVWVAFKENIKMISSRLALEGIKCVTFDGSSSEEEKNDAVEAFNKDRETRVFIGIAASGGVGLNLVGFDSTCPELYETNCTDVIYYSSNWSSVNRLQAMDRAHRHNTRVPVHVTDLLVPSSIDTEIYSRVEGKIKMSLTLQDIKKILQLL